MGEQTKPELIHCKCNHLTSFASDFLVAPNPIDFDKVFSADLSENFVVLLVVCLIFGLYILLVVIARRFDKKDLEKVGFAAISPAEGHNYRGVKPSLSRQTPYSRVCLKGAVSSNLAKFSRQTGRVTQIS